MAVVLIPLLIAVNINICVINDILSTIGSYLDVSMIVPGIVLNIICFFLLQARRSEFLFVGLPGIVIGEYFNKSFLPWNVIRTIEWKETKNRSEAYITTAGGLLDRWIPPFISRNRQVFFQPVSGDYVKNRRF